ncbi:hypothetical protein C5167_002830 [Papaver somniferum]|uniref:Uncharacterized protein n=1 Tax=Papaver somniferum TaxID=3469 RepID=A0A4Y7L1X4_PAPSO|nr:hypothetical protein C5167_002830 [Papaver somniferum]
MGFNERNINPWYFSNGKGRVFGEDERIHRTYVFEEDEMTNVL